MKPVSVLFSDHQYERVLSRKKWEIMLNPEIHENWYLQNRRKWGDIRYIFKRLLAPLYVGWSVMITTLLICGLWRIYTLITSLATLVCWALIIYYWRSFPVIQDVLFIRSELRIFVIITAFVFALFLSGSVLVLMDWQYNVFYVMCCVLAMEFVMAAQMAIIILYPQYKLREHQELKMSEAVSFSSPNSHAGSRQFKSWKAASLVFRWISIFFDHE